MNKQISTNLLLAVAGIAFIGLPAIVRAAEVDDGWIVSATKMAMWTTPGVPSTDVAVDSLNGRVVLHGKVETAAEKATAERVARGIDGVKEVRNLLQVVPPSIDDAVNNADDKIEERVNKAFKAQRGLAGTKIQVASVSKGVVVLTGDASTMSEHMLAVETAHSVPGVRTVATQVRGPKRIMDEEVASEESPHAGHNGYITAAVKTRLIADHAVPALDVKVDTHGSTVVLFGEVPTLVAKQAAEKDAHLVKGVDRVVNDIQVVPASEHKWVAAKDGQVKDSIKKAFEGHEDFKKIDVDVKAGVVHLSGTVATASSKWRASILARSTAGVRSVDNDLQVKHSG